MLLSQNAHDPLFWLFRNVSGRGYTSFCPLHMGYSYVHKDNRAWVLAAVMASRELD